MTVPLPVAEIVEAEGHLIDSQLLNVIFDTVIKWDASFEVLQFTIGRTNDEPSFVSMRIASSTEDGLHRVLEELVPLGCQIARAERRAGPCRRTATAACRTISIRRPTSRQLVRHGGRWLEVERQRMDSVDRHRGRQGDLPQAPRRADRRAGRVRRGRRESGAGVPGTRPPGLRVHDERDLVGAQGRGAASRASPR